MRLFVTTFLILILASCGTLNQSGNLRLVKVNGQDIPVIEKNTAKSDKKIKLDNSVQSPENTDLAVVKNNPDKQIQSQNQKLEKNIPIVKSDIEDLEPEEDEDAKNEEIINQALRTERKAGVSLTLSIAGLISIFVPYIGIIFFIIGLVTYSNAKSFRYTTPRGEERLRASKVLLIIDAVVLFLWLMLILLLLVLFF